MRITAPPTDLDIDPKAVDLLDPGLYADGDPHAVWQVLRDRDPVHWQELADGRGFWSVTRYEEVERVLRDHATFTSERGNLLYTLGADDPAAGKMMPSTDPPRHAWLRDPIAKALSAKALADRDDEMRAAVRRLLEPALDGQPWDVADAAAALPMALLGPLLDIDEDDWEWLGRASLEAVAPEEFQPDNATALAEAHYEIFEYFSDLVLERDGADDLVGDMLASTIDGRQARLDEVVYNSYSLLLGANVTTPHAVSATLLALAERPASYDLLATDPSLITNAVEEGLRWSSPGIHFLRHATDDVTLDGVRIAVGEPVVAWVASANRDEDVFTDPYLFDVCRRPNRHLAFGVGRHYCVGAALTRRTMELLFGEFVRSVRRWELAGPVAHLRSIAIGGFTSLPIIAVPR